MILCDTGIMVALVNRRDNHHAATVQVMGTLTDDLVTTLACVTEAMYLLGKYGGLSAQDELWGFIEDGLLEVRNLDSDSLLRMRALMREYADTPMDFADASLVALAEAANTRRIFTVDRHFHAYQIGGSDHFEILP
jgi:predicted nucleic acid-binding protein